MKNFFLLISCTLFLLQGCQTTPTQNTEIPAEPVVYTPGEFNRESLYDLLLAEIAGQRRQFPIALNNYINQAQKTGDAAVAERATRIAQYVRNPDKIREAAQIWRDIDKENPEPYQIEASILLHQNQYAEALPLLKKALEYDAPRTLALIRAQSGNISSNVVNGYVQMLEAHEQNSTPDADLQLTVALLHKAAGEPQKALTAFNNALLLNPKSVETLVQKAELLREQGKIPDAIKLIQTAFEHQPDNRQLHLLFTQLLFQNERHKDAVSQAMALIETNPKDHQLTYYLALLMLENEQIDSAEAVFQSLFALKPDDSSPHYYLGHIAQSRGNTQQAITHFSQVKDGSNALQALSRATGLLNSPAEKSQVQQMLLDARTRMPKQAAQIYTLEAEWLNLHQFEEEALTLLDDALKLHQDNTTLLYTRAMLIEETDFAQAERDFKRILELEPDNSMTMNALGYTLLLHTTRYQEAYDLIRAALDQEPEDPAILDSMGWVLFKLQRYDEAVAYLEKAHQLFADPEVSGHLIQAYWANGQKAKAKELLQESKINNPDNPFLKEAEQAIGVE